MPSTISGGNIIVSGIINIKVDTPVKEKIAEILVTGRTQFALANTGAIPTIGAPPPTDKRKEIKAAT